MWRLVWKTRHWISEDTVRFFLLQLASGDVVSDFVQGTLNTALSGITGAISSAQSLGLSVSQQVQTAFLGASEAITSQIAAALNATQQYAASLNDSSQAVQACLKNQTQQVAEAGNSSCK
jgi:ABC-type transporter Mla subunit MlaD